MDFYVHGSFRFSSPGAFYCRRIDRIEYFSAKRQSAARKPTPTTKIVSATWVTWILKDLGIEKEKK
jgi:hypothetical protein